MLEKILLIASLLFCVSTLLAVGYIGYQGVQISKYKAKYAEAVQASIRAETAILKQNALIEAYRLDLEAAKENVRVETRVITEYAEREKVKVVERLIKDRDAFPADGQELRACENKLSIITEQLEAFYAGNY
jgi:hypothetical protein